MREIPTHIYIYVLCYYILYRHYEKGFKNKILEKKTFYNANRN